MARLRRKRERVRPPDTRPPRIGNSLVQAVHRTYGPLRPNGHTVRGPGSVGPNTASARPRAAPPQRQDAAPTS